MLFKLQKNMKYFGNDVTTYLPGVLDPVGYIYYQEDTTAIVI